MLPAFLRRIFQRAPVPPSDPFAASARNLCDMIPVCPLCGSSLAGHSFTTTLAEAGNKEDMLKLISLFDSKEWEQLSQIHSFDGTKNAVCAKAIACPAGAGFTVTFISYEELWSNDELVKSQALDAAEWSLLLRRFPNVDWHPI